ncbi:MAG: hypothetical protein R2729_12585 [Bryobacteraceae bacterium]
MGICITYSGKLADPARLDELLDAVRGFCRRVKWRFEEESRHLCGTLLFSPKDVKTAPEPEPKREKRKYRSLDDIAPPPAQPFGYTVGSCARLIDLDVRGVIVMPPDTDPFQLVFDSNGELLFYIEVPDFMVINAAKGESYYAAFPFFAKTSGAVRTHSLICTLLTLIRPYMKRFRVTDPTGYWKTGNLDKLIGEHMVMGALGGVLAESSLGGLLAGEDPPRAPRSQRTRDRKT